MSQKKPQVFAAQFAEVRKLSKKEMLVTSGGGRRSTETYTYPTQSSTYLGLDDDNTGGDTQGENGQIQ